MADDPITVRAARDEEVPAVMNVLDAAMLEVDATDVRLRIADDGVLVAVEAGRVLGACVVEPGGPTSEDAEAGADVDALAVRPGRRGQGVGSALVEAAAERRGSLAAEFDADLRPFYESLGFEVVDGDGDRCRGVRRTRR